MPALLSVIIPVYNEVSTILEILEAVNSVDIDKEIVVVNNGSSDGTTEKLRSIDYSKFKNIKVIQCSENRGKGAAFLTGLLNSSGEFVIIQDADLEYNPQDYHALLDLARINNAAVVYGSRFLSGKNKMSPLQYMANRFLTFITNMFFGTSLTDMETCYKMVKRDVLLGLGLQAKKFEMEPEITIKLIKKGLKINEVPISYQGRSYSGGKKIGWVDGCAALFLIIKLKFSIPPIIKKRQVR